MAEFFTAFIGVFVAAYILVPVSQSIGLVDKPDDRKHHTGAVPLVGGIAIFASMALASLIFVPRSADMTYLLAASALLVMTGSLDDRYHLNVRVRLAVQAISAGLLIWGAHIELLGFGTLFAPLWDQAINLHWLSVPVTILAIVGMINAFNMIDGLDGLSAGLSLITALALFSLLGTTIGDGASNILLLMIGALTAYLMLNLHWFPKWSPKIFLGDAGSMLLGLVITAFLIRYSQGTKELFMPVTALWLVAVPLMDILVTTLRRVRHGRSAFRPDRTHIHHIFLRAKLSPKTTLVLILGVQALAAGTGVLLERLQVNALWSLAGFVLLFILYLEFVKHAFQVAKFIRGLGRGPDAPDHRNP